MKFLLSRTFSASSRSDNSQRWLPEPVVYQIDNRDARRNRKADAGHYKAINAHLSPWILREWQLGCHCQDIRFDDIGI
jgi:hypothetical protein